VTPAQQQAVKWIKRAIDERVDELTDSWKAEQDPAKREELHAHARATIELEDYLNARISSYADE
jgi:hypothetical protein